MFTQHTRTIYVNRRSSGANRRIRPHKGGAKADEKSKECLVTDLTEKEAQMNNDTFGKIAFADVPRLEIEVLEERVAPGLLLFGGANVAAGLNVAVVTSNPCCVPAAAPPPPPPPPCCCPCWCWC